MTLKFEERIIPEGQKREDIYNKIKKKAKKTTFPGRRCLKNGKF